MRKAGGDLGRSVVQPLLLVCVMDLIAAFEASVAGTTAPPAFRRWAGISLAAAAIARNASVRVAGSPIYPNLFVILVTRSGVGKNSVIEPAKAAFRDCLNGTRGTELAPDKTTLRRLVARLGAPTPVGENDPPTQIDAVCSCFANEFRVLVPAHEIQTMEVLSDLYECQSEWHGETQHAGCDHLYNVCINILGGAQLGYFSAASGFHPAAIHQGILARYTLIYSEDKQPLRMTQAARDAPDSRALLPMLRQLRRPVGQVFFTPGAFTAYTDWYARSAADRPDSPIMTSYNERRHVLAAKLALIRALTRGHSDITLGDFEDALAWQLTAEEGMPTALAALGASPTRGYENAVVETVNRRGRVPEAECRRLLARNIPAAQVTATLDHLVASGQLVVASGEAPRRVLAAPKLEV